MSTDKKTILVPLDFSTASNNALQHAVHLATTFNEKLLLLYVVEDSIFRSIFGGSLEKSMLLETISNKIQEKVDTINADYPDIEVEKLVAEGKIYKKIIKTAESAGADTIVMGYHGHSALENFIGSTTSRVLRSATVPVVIVKELPASFDYKKIILPIDLTKESRQKVTWGVHLARKYDSEIHVIMEVENDEFLKKKVSASLHQVEKFLNESGVRYVSKLLDDREYPDHFGKDIIKYSEEIDADLILIMTQKEQGLREFFLGSFAREVISGSKNTPVLCINPKELGSVYWATESF